MHEPRINSPNISIHTTNTEGTCRHINIITLPGMRKKTFLILFMLAAVFAAQAESRWTYYGAYHNSLVNIQVSGNVFSLCDGSIFSYSPSDGEAKIYNKTTGLSDAGIKHMVYCEELECFVLVYSNSNIDVFYPGLGKVSNIPQLMNSNLADKTVNDITISGKYAYIATNSGVSLLDISRLEFSRTYNIGTVSSAVLLNGKILAATPSGIIQGNVSENLLDPSNWSKLNDPAFTKLRVLGDRLYAQARHVFEINATTGIFVAIDNVPATFFCNGNDQYIFFGNSDAAYAVSPDGTKTKICGSNSFKHLSYSNGTYWASCGFNGTQPYKADENGMLKAVAQGITLNSPIRNYCAFMNVSSSNRILVAGGTLNYNLQNFDGTLYSYKNGKFFNFEDTVSSHTNIPYRNLTGVAEDPYDPTHVFASSGETGLYEFRNGMYAAHFDSRNSPLQSAVPDAWRPYLYVRTGGLQYDGDGNLWMLNNEVDTILKIMMRNGTWQSIYIDELANYPTFDHLVFDNDGRAWFTHRRTTSKHNAGVACLDVNGTIGDTSDDTFTFRYRLTNEDGTTYTPNTVDAIAKDNDGRIWVGTVEGPFLINDPENFANSNFTFEQVKVPRNDGTDYADYLLTGVPITAIAVDAANRKWFGTKGDGVYLVGADNIETVHHFTASNSPLVSDNVLSLAVNRETGEVMIGTDKGLMGYNAGKVSTGKSFKDKDLKIYPNPVRPDFYGDVTIEGLPLGAEVKITTTGGQLVRTAKTSNGFYKWDVKDSSGAGVGSGVYYVLAVTSDGKHGARGRIVVVR